MQIQRRAGARRLPLLGVFLLVAACNEDGLPLFVGDFGTTTEAGAVDLGLPPDLSLSTADLTPGCFALFIDRCGGWAVAPASGNYDPQDSLTIEAWLWFLGDLCSVDMLPAADIVRHRSDDGRSGYELQITQYNPEPAPRYALGLWPGTAGGGPIPLGRWVHVAGVYDSATEMDRLFIDGMPAGRAVGYKPMPVVAPLYIAAGLTNHFHGYVADVRVTAGARYLEAFTPERRFKPDPYTLALYHFDEPDGLVGHDASGHGNDAKLTNGARFALPPACL